ncbi:hypothetical protein [Nocardia otitidiscaviarum]|uniref:hypothetical protein n=1 Tax=Nocardia otitidiscaviarum TaxID=1823 RepID=UPI00163DB542|nr:hypothetical protein [Nocardia otitidiscaviarum]MCP9621008.1 hypothetical protein [Nocardia otitidiscaviarum]
MVLDSLQVLLMVYSGLAVVHVTLVSMVRRHRPRDPEVEKWTAAAIISRVQHEEAGASR